MSWLIREEGFVRGRITNNGNKFMTGNGYLGYRGTLEEYGKEQLTACNLAGLYDRQGDSWREPVNAPNGFFTRLFVEGAEIGLLQREPAEHVQQLDIRHGLHQRDTVWETEKGRIRIRAERFVSLADVHLMVLRYSVTSDRDCQVCLETGIDGDVWDINGPHLEAYSLVEGEGFLRMDARTQELKIPVSVAEVCSRDFEAAETLVKGDRSILRRITFLARANVCYTISKFVTVFTGNDGVTGVGEACAEAVVKAAKAGYDEAYTAHALKWRYRWQASDVVIEGDEQDQLALRYSIYHLHIIAPVHARAQSIPARGLSGQTYKGAIFWDTEMFMLPFFLHTAPEVAKSLVNYRVQTLEGARRKAAYYGFRGAFYAWESQETGDDACSDFNVTDIFTGRPVKTYFKDKQVHISADVAYAIWETWRFTGDAGILLDGGAEVILECARFFYSYAYYKEDRNRYEILDVIGPDEYHERVNNNAFTNKMIYHTLDIALQTLDLLITRYPEEYRALVAKLNYGNEIAHIVRLKEKLYVPGPDGETHIIEQFDGYLKLEDCSLAEVKSRLLDPKEYWGGGHGVTITTQIIKQADVVLMLYLFGNDFSQEVKKANWAYYESRSEHGSSLSPCVYSLLSCDTGNPEWAYPFFVKTANIDLTGESKQFAGSIYIGGTHPAANGGAWMAAILGFAGLTVEDGNISVRPNLPEKWTKLAFRVVVRGEWHSIVVTRDGAEIRKLEKCGSLDIGPEVEQGRGVGQLHPEGSEPNGLPFSLIEPGYSDAGQITRSTEDEIHLDHGKGAIFDLDGVIVDTAKYHYLAWKRLAEELNFEFRESDNERLKGVSRMRSLDILLEVGKLQFSDEEKLKLAEKKNNWYVEYISAIDETELLEGAREYLEQLRNSGVKIALGSASRNSQTILDRLGITGLFDSIVDGNKVSKAKPDPEVFLLAAKEIGLQPEECIVYEDAEAGIAAAKAAGMRAVGIGRRDILKEADLVVPGLHVFSR